MIDGSKKARDSGVECKAMFLAQFAACIDYLCRDPSCKCCQDVNIEIVKRLCDDGYLGRMPCVNSMRCVTISVIQIIITDRPFPFPSVLSAVRDLELHTSIYLLVPDECCSLSARLVQTFAIGHSNRGPQITLDDQMPLLSPRVEKFV